MPHARAPVLRIAGVTLTHPDRVPWPEGPTKRDLATHMAALAGRLLPHLAGRPLTLLRCPSGRGGACFVQKHPWAGLPDAVTRVRPPDTAEEWLAVKDVAGLVALVQMGVVELHPWGARVADLDRPDRLILDLDPEAGVAWGRVVAGAKAIRARLAARGLTGFVKTTGGKGLHVVVPLVPAAGWDTAKAFAHDLAAALAGDEPDLYTVNPLKEARAGRIFLDYLRNSRGATAVAPYSPRARPGAPVAVPLGWDELDGLERADGWTVATLPDRLAALTRDPWEGFFTVEQRL